MDYIFDVNKYKSENSKLTLKSEQKRIISTGMYQAYKAMKNNSVKTRKPLWYKSIAAALAILLIGGAAFWGINMNNPAENWFAVKVGAIDLTGDKSIYERDSNLAAEGHSNSEMTGWFMNNKEKDGYKDDFAYYLMEDFKICGANIKSVKVKSNTKGIYFALIPQPKEPNGILPDSDDSLAIDKALKDSGFGDMHTINNSQYTFEELRSETSNFIFWPCDGFSYNIKKVSTGKESNIIPDRTMDIILESDHNDSEIAGWLKEIAKIRIDGYEPSDYEPNDYNRIVALEEKIQEKMMKDAQISVTVVYADDKTETQTIDLVYSGNGHLSFAIKDR